MSKIPSWLLRKYKQADELQYNQKRERQVDIATAVSQVVSSIFGEKADLILPSLEEAKGMFVDAESNDKKVVKKIWWK